MKKLNAIELTEFSNKVREALIENKTWRAGQGMFNVLVTYRPQLAESIRSTDADPFYMNSKIKQFFAAILDDDAMANLNPRWK